MKYLYQAIAFSAAIGSIAGAAQGQQGPAFQPDGTVKVPAFELPASDFSSAEARAQQQARAKMTGNSMAVAGPVPIATRRAMLDGYFASRIAQMRKDFPVDIAETTIAGVPVKDVTPKGRKPVKDRVLINLHGGAFSVCWEACSQIESIPIAALGGYRVVSVNYRMAPEHRHPAGVEDVAAVYRELLKTYKASRIGIFGCSAGGALTAQAAAWLPAHGLPQAGAIGIFGAGGVRFESGDSHYIAAAVDGSFGPPRRPGTKGPDLAQGYFAGVDPGDAIVSPGSHPEMLAKFPPTLLITGTRAMDMSPAIVTNSALLRAGRKSTLIVGEAMGHCYIMSPELPESRDAYAAIIAHFRENLK